MSLQTNNINIDFILDVNKSINQQDNIKKNKEEICYNKEIYEYKKKFNSIINEILKIKHKQRKVCKECHELGHSSTSVKCKLNIEKSNLLKNKIKKYMLLQDCLSGKTNEEHIIELSNILEITQNRCKTLYDEIPQKEFNNRKMDIDLYIKNIKIINCYQCNQYIYDIKTNTNHIWKNNIICDICWYKYNDERNQLWKCIREYKKMQCNICDSIKILGQRFHYDHISMFDKTNSICSMVNEGQSLEDIYLELDKCQVLCLSCHHIVTDIESKLGFTRIKQTLTRKLNNKEITDEEYENQKIDNGELYIKKMKEIYIKLKLTLNKLY